MIKKFSKHEDTSVKNGASKILQKWKKISEDEKQGIKPVFRAPEEEETFSPPEEAKETVQTPTTTMMTGADEEGDRPDFSKAKILEFKTEDTIRDNIRNAILKIFSS